MVIEKAIAFALARRGVKTILNGQDADKLRSTEIEFLINSFEVIFFMADIRFPSQCADLVKTCIEQYGRLDILINNAGVSTGEP